MTIARVALIIAFIALAVRLWYAPGRHGSSVRAARIAGYTPRHGGTVAREVYRIVRGWDHVRA